MALKTKQQVIDALEICFGEELDESNCGKCPYFALAFSDSEEHSRMEGAMFKCQGYLIEDTVEYLKQ